MSERVCQCFFCQGFPVNFTTEEVHAAAAEMILDGQQADASEQTREEPAE
jgi:hypothetical protein